MLKWDKFNPEANEPREPTVRYKYSKLPWVAAYQYNLETRANGKKLTVTGPRKDSLMLI